MRGAADKRFQPCCGYFLQGAVKWICVTNILQIFVGVGLILIDVYQRWDRWILEKRENHLAFTVRYWIWIAYWFHVFTALPIDIYLFPASRARDTKGLLWWIIGTFLSSSWAGIVYYFHTAYFGLHIPTITIYNGYLVYRYYTLVVVYSYIKEIEYDEKTSRACRQLTDEEIREFEEGIQWEKKKRHSYQNDVISNEYVNNNQQVEIEPSGCIEHAQYSRYKREEYEISLDSISIDESHVLGAGAYGKVFKGHLLGVVGQNPALVAVKTINHEDSDVTIFKALLSELKVMSYLGKHENIVTLIGATTSDIKNKKLFIIVEFCAFGSLYDYLKGCRGLFSSLVKNGVLCKNLSEMDSYSAYNESDGISTKDLFKWCYQIADGMDYLESRKVIHGDLATRNVLLTAERQIKITDFGLSRQLYQYAIYVKKQNTPLPWRWLAVESLTDMNFSAKSDVWSYGVTVWEIFSLSETPWSQVTFNLEFVKKLKNGMRMAMPPNCTVAIYEVMLCCWRKEPDDRASFKDLSKFFRDSYNFLES